MDRFIAKVQKADFCICWIFKIQYGQIYRGKHKGLQAIALYLKSSMDRFIAATLYEMCFIPLEFKIQYGQIYRN